MPTEQEQFWSGTAGDAYTARNNENLVHAKVEFFAKVLTKNVNITQLRSVIEFGANRGLNLQALRYYFEVLKEVPRPTFAAVEVNASAVERLRNSFVVDEVFHLSMLDCAEFTSPYDLAFTMGVLIHIHPDDLPKAYDTLYAASKRYILVAEYFSRQPVEIEYRGQMGRLWKRDFAAELLDRHTDLKLVDYGFVSRLDPVAPLDDIHWWLCEKVA